eukprot:1159892-Pelagomonas_calceolata.AAC.26
MGSATFFSCPARTIYFPMNFKLRSHKHKQQLAVGHVPIWQGAKPGAGYRNPEIKLQGANSAG